LLCPSQFCARDRRRELFLQGGRDLVRSHFPVPAKGKRAVGRRKIGASIPPEVCLNEITSS
jgi:hypothetical protein